MNKLEGVGMGVEMRNGSREKQEDRQEIRGYCKVLRVVIKMCLKLGWSMEVVLREYLEEGVGQENFGEKEINDQFCYGFDNDQIVLQDI